MSRLKIIQSATVIHRLDFLDFELDGGSAIDRPCDRDSIEVFSSGATNLGMGPLCGRNTDQHLYIPVTSQQSVPMLRVVTDARMSGNFTTDYKWNIKITQIDCTDNNEEIRELRGTYLFYLIHYEFW